MCATPVLGTTHISPKSKNKRECPRGDIMNSHFDDVQLTTIDDQGVSYPAYEFGSATTVGFELTDRPLATYPGSASFTQLVDSTILESDADKSVRRAAFETGGILDIDNLSGASFLDTPSGGLVHDLRYLDPPIILVSSELWRNDNFTIYLQWQSNKAQSIRVPIKEYSWFWQVHITSPNGPYFIDNQISTSDGFDVGANTTEHPEWVNQILDYKYEYY